MSVCDLCDLCVIVGACATVLKGRLGEVEPSVRRFALFLRVLLEFCVVCVILGDCVGKFFCCVPVLCATVDCA